MSGRQNDREISSRRFYTADEAIAMVSEEFFEPCCAGSDDELSAEELNNDDGW